MKKLWLLLMAGIAACPGCTTFLLKEYSLRQTKTSGSGRDSLVMNCLATVAANPDALPSYALYSSGISTVTDSVILSQTTAWAALQYTLKTLGLTAATSPKGQWTVDPTVEYQQMEAVHAACLWALFGPESAMKTYPAGILGDPQEYLDGKPHFGVERRLRMTRPGWVHFGRLEDVPVCARYKGHEGKMWVWVMPEDSESFAQFTLVLQDIATLDPPIIAPPPILVTLTTSRLTDLPDITATEGSKTRLSISTSEIRAVKKEYKEIIEEAIRSGIKTDGGRPGKVNLTRAQWMAYTEPYAGVRNPAGVTPVTPSPNVTSAPVNFTYPLQLPPLPVTAPPSPSPR